jgi:hypothetical protein
MKEIETERLRDRETASERLNEHEQTYYQPIKRRMDIKGPFLL